MAIFGYQNPKIVYDPSGANVTVDLPYSVIETNEPEYEYIMHQSEIDGSRKYVKRGKHWVTEIKYHLFKHEGEAYQKYLEINQYEGSEIIFHLHKDNPPISDGSEAAVPFILKHVIPFYITQRTYKDGLLLRFESTKFVDISKSASAPVGQKLLDGIGTGLTDGTGKLLLDGLIK